MVFEGKIKTEIILHHKHVRTEKHFRKMHFSCATKHLYLQKSISGNNFQPIQTQPNILQPTEQTKDSYNQTSEACGVQEQQISLQCHIKKLLVSGEPIISSKGNFSH